MCKRKYDLYVVSLIVLKNFSDMENENSPPMEEPLRRKDSDSSWKPDSQGFEDEAPTPLDPNKMFLVSLSTLMALFT
jgi:hypothetical protein